MAAVKSYPAAPVAFAFEGPLTIGVGASGLTAATYAPTGQKAADEALVTVETQSIRYRQDGVDPTSAIGVLVAAGASFTVRGAAAIARLRLIRATGADGAIQVQYSRFVR